MHPTEIERGLRALLHLVHRAAPWELEAIATRSALLRAQLTAPTAQRDECRIASLLWHLDGECLRLFHLRFEDLATLDVDARSQMLAIVRG
jgi:hypothetical protein